MALVRVIGSVVLWGCKGWNLVVQQPGYVTVRGD